MSKRNKNINLNEIITSYGCVVMNSAYQCNHNKTPILLHSPEKVFTAYSLDEVKDVICKIEKYIKQGKYAAGFFTYEMGGAFGLAVKQIPKDSALPLIWVGIYSSQTVHSLPEDFLNAYILEHHNSICSHSKCMLSITEDDYIHSIKRIKELIAAGDTYQVNFTINANIEIDVPPFPLFCRLLKTHPVPYAAYINGENWQILSISPELFLQKKGNILQSRPMKGTIRRGLMLCDDLKSAESLQNSEKDRAENVMILDMMRNDIGKICAHGSITIPQMFQIEKYRSLFQMTSTICGTLLDIFTLSDIFEATFPASSITGAPKHRTMEIISSLEDAPRGVYTGSIGLFTPRGDFTLNVAIRTLVHTEGKYTLGIGSGIVWDSDPEKEFAEVHLKSHFAIKPLPVFEIIETMLLDTSRKYLFLYEHLERLSQSASYWDFPFDKEQALNLLNDFRLTVEKFPEIVRISLADDGKMKVTSRAYIPQTSTVILKLSSHKIDSNNRFLRHKTTHRAVYNNELERAKNDGCFEVIFVNEKNHITEGSVTSIFFKKNKEWFTPPIDDGLLPGIWRARFIAEHNAIQQSIPLNTIKNFNEIIIGNSVRDILYVQKIVNSEGEILWGS